MVENIKLTEYEDRLKDYFLNKKKEEPDSEIYLLDHDLSDSELIELDAILTEHFRETHYFQHVYMLCYLVIITQVAFDFDGLRFWKKLIEKFKVPDHYNFWEGYSSGKARSKILDFYEFFQNSFNGVVPLGNWAENKRYISPAITHAILPKNLQKELFKYIKNRLDYIESHHFDTPKALGKEISKSYLSYNTQFDTLFDHPILLGSLVLDISGESPNTEEGKSQLIVFNPSTLTKIKENLEDDLEEDIKIRTSQAKKRRAITLTSANKIRTAQRENRKVGIHFSLDLERSKDTEHWSLKLNLPRIRVKLRTDTDFLNKSRLFIMSNGADGYTEIVTKGALEFSSRSFQINDLPNDDQPLIELDLDNTLSALSNERADETIQRIQDRFTSASFLGIEPWLFALDSTQTNAKRASSIMPGKKYLLLQKEDSKDISIGDWISRCEIDVKNLSIYEINLPTDYLSGEKAVLDNLGIKISSDLIKLQPFGLNISPKNSEIIRWIKSQEYLFKLEVTERLNQLKLSFLENEEELFVQSEKINEQGEYFLSLTSDFPMPVGLSCQIQLTTEKNEHYEERLDFDFIETEAWRPGYSHEVAFTAGFFDSEKNEPIHLSFEDFMDNEYEVDITFPVRNCGEISLALVDQNQDEILNHGPIKIESMRLSSQDWAHHILEKVQSLSHEELDSVYSARLTVDASEYGLKHFNFNSSKAIELSFRHDSNHKLELIDLRESDYEDLTSLIFYDISKPWNELKYSNDKILDTIEDQRTGLYRISDHYIFSFDSFVFVSSEAKDILNEVSDQNLDIQKFLERYRIWYRARAIDKKSRELRRLALLNISSMIINQIINNDAGLWSECERKYFQTHDKMVLKEGLSKSLKSIPGYSKEIKDNIENTIEKITALAESKDKRQIIFVRNGAVPMRKEDCHQMASSLKNDFVSVSRQDLVLEDGRIFLFQDEKNFDSGDLVKMEELVNLESEDRINVKKISIDNTWKTDYLIDRLKHNPIEYFIRSKGIQEQAIELIVNLATRPGIFIEEQPEHMFIKRAQIEASKLPELVPIVRFLTLYSAHIVSERFKPLFRAWEWEDSL